MFATSDFRWTIGALIAAVFLGYVALEHHTMTAAVPADVAAPGAAQLWRSPTFVWAEYNGFHQVDCVIVMPLVRLIEKILPVCMFCYSPKHLTHCVNGFSEMPLC